MVSMWKPCGVYLETTWCPCGNYVSIWKPHGVHLETMWFLHGNHMMFTWKPHGGNGVISMVKHDKMKTSFPQVEMMFPCFNHIVSMSYLNCGLKLA